LPNGIIAAGTAAIGMSFWAYNEYLSYTPFDRRNRKLVGWTLLLYLFTSMAISVITLSRDELMLVIVGLFVININKRLSTQKVRGSWRGKVFSGIFSLLIMFSALSALRGNASPDKLINGFFGYTVSGYNRMAAIVHHQIPFKYAGSGTYLFGGIPQNRTINDLIPLKTHYNMPEQLDAWLSDFAAVGAAGLTAQYTFCSCFGFLFVDIGWWAIIAVFATGMFSGWVWRLFKSGNLFGILLYPMVASSILLWFAKSSLISMTSVILALTFLFLFAYMSLLKLIAFAVSKSNNDDERL
jgi:hypothetical protein